MSGHTILSNIDINDFDYNLPDARIAKFPKENRDESGLLIHQHSKTLKDRFYNIAAFLPENSLLVLNNTKVVRARLFFRKATGAIIEIFCLEPVSPTTEIQLAFQQCGSATWKCLIGNARRWKSEVLVAKFEHSGLKIILKAERIEKTGDAFLIKFSWEPDTLTFSELLEAAGKIPLPPYLNREAIDRDTETYQTVYARHDGSVAAPTAGLHFTEKVFDSLKNKNISMEYLTLHVGAGTFKPVGKDGIAQHEMHTEQVLISRDFIQKIEANIGNIIAVGTTSVRSLESLYWFGVKLSINPDADFRINQFDPYELNDVQPISALESIGNILEFMNRNKLEVIGGTTQLMIVPGYTYRMIKGMITNFHQPRSTLLLLISAWLGSEWKTVYDFALNNDFRFLSYGDSCLFL